MAQSSQIRHVASWGRSIFFFAPLIYFFTVVFGSLSLLSSLFDRGGEVQHGFARMWSRLILRTCGMPVTIAGKDRLNSEFARVYAANHISALDIPVLYGNLPFQFRIVAKKELFRYPFLGWHLRRSGQLPIDQTNPTSAIRSLRKAVETLRQGMPLVIFPEGGRSENGQLQPFMTGAFYLAIKAQVPVVPMAIAGTYEALPMDHFHIHPRGIELRVGEAIPTRGLDLRDMEALSNRVRTEIDKMCRQKSADSEQTIASSAL